MQNKENEEAKEKVSAEELVVEETAKVAAATDTQEEKPTEVPPEVDERDIKIEALQGKLLRLQADFDNLRRRNSEEQTQLAGFVTVGVVNKFLKVLDNFERAEKSIEQSPDSGTIKVGLEKIHKQFEQALKELNVVEIPAQGEKFNPGLHEAIMRAENEQFSEDTIDMVLEKGYKINDRVVRHSKVRVVTKG